MRMFISCHLCWFSCWAHCNNWSIRFLQRLVWRTSFSFYETCKPHSAVLTLWRHQLYSVLPEHCDSFAFTGIQSNDFPNYFLRASGTLFLLRGRGCRSVRPRARSLEGTLRGSPVFKVARRAGRWYILVARLENTLAPGRRASDFASPGAHWEK